MSPEGGPFIETAPTQEQAYKAMDQYLLHETERGYGMQTFLGKMTKLHADLNWNERRLKGEGVAINEQEKANIREIMKTQEAQIEELLADDKIKRLWSAYKPFFQYK